MYYIEDIILARCGSIHFLLQRTWSEVEHSQNLWSMDKVNSLVDLSFGYLTI